MLEVQLQISLCITHYDLRATQCPLICWIKSHWLVHGQCSSQFKLDRCTGWSGATIYLRMTYLPCRIRVYSIPNNIDKFMSAIKCRFYGHLLWSSQTNWHDIHLESFSLSVWEIKQLKALSCLYSIDELIYSEHAAFDHF